MNTTSVKAVASFGLTAAMLALSAAAFAADAPMGAMGKSIGANDQVHCYKVNDCKGTADCKTADHSCKGMNTCKGQGFKALSAGQCLTKGGTISDL